MVRFLAFASLMLFSCTSNRNAEGRLRVKINKFTIAPSDCSPADELTNPLVFYKLIPNSRIIEHRINRFISEDIVEGFKFYKGGKVGYFSNVDLSNEQSLNPQKAIMGVYNCTNNYINIQLISKFPQKGIVLWKERLEIIDKEVNVLKGYVLATGDSVQYKKVSLDSQNVLPYLPDW